MASLIECLPTELLDVITEQLDLTDVALLVQCSKQLHHRIEPFLYASQAALDKAMFWACKNGKLSTIHLAVSYAADVSIVHVRKRIRRVDYYLVKPLSDKIPVLTLHLAARNHHVDAFELLLELGAQIDGKVDAYQLKYLMRRFSINNVLLDYLLKAGLGPQVRERPNLGISLVSIIRFGGSVDVVRQLLDNGANPLMDQHKGGGVFTPLTAAIGVNSASLFGLFIERGADIHGGNLAEVSNPFKPLHIPVFAAARAMAEHGVEMMQRCLDLGVDINHRYHRRVHAHANRSAANTPLLVYLDSIDPWKSPMTLRPVDGLAYLLKNHAALWHPPVYIDGIKFETQPPLEFLLDKWGYRRLASPEFFAAASFLVKNGASKYHTQQILSKCNNRYRGYYSSTTRSDVVRAWGHFVDLVLEYREGPVMIDDLLIHFVRDKVQLGGLEMCTVECLLNAGANINARYQAGGATVLHLLAYATIFNNFGASLGLTTTRRVIFSSFSFLVEKGADLAIVAEGRTAVDILRDAMATVHILKRNKQHLSDLIDFLQEKKDGRYADSAVETPALSA